MTMLTDEELLKLEELEEKATGPFGMKFNPYNYSKNWEFIHELRNAAKSLIASARRENKYLRLAQYAIDYAKSCKDDGTSNGATDLLGIIASEALKKGDHE